MHDTNHIEQCVYSIHTKFSKSKLGRGTGYRPALTRVDERGGSIFRTYEVGVGADIATVTKPKQPSTSCDF